MSPETSSAAESDHSPDTSADHSAEESQNPTSGQMGKLFYFPTNDPDEDEVVRHFPTGPNLEAARDAGWDFDQVSMEAMRESDQDPLQVQRDIFEALKHAEETLERVQKETRMGSRINTKDPDLQKLADNDLAYLSTPEAEGHNHALQRLRAATEAVYTVLQQQVDTHNQLAMVLGREDRWVLPNDLD